MTITYRLVKGSAITAAEHDATLTHIENSVPISVKNYDPVGDDTTDDLVAIQAALDTGETILIDGTYFLGAKNSGNFLNITTPGQVIIFTPGSFLRANGTDTVTNTAVVIQIDSVSGVTIINQDIRSNYIADTVNVNPDRDAPYAVGLLCTTGNCNNTTFINPRASNCQALVVANKTGFSDEFEVNDIAIVNGYADTCIYGGLFANTGNNVRGNWRTLNAVRPFFAYGCHGHECSVVADYDASQPVVTAANISAYSHNGSIAAKDTYGIRYHYVTNDSETDAALLTFNGLHTTGDGKLSVIHDIDINIVENSARTDPGQEGADFHYWLDAADTTPYTGNLFDRIKVSGYLRQGFGTTNLVQNTKGHADFSNLVIGTGIAAGNQNPHDGYLFDQGFPFNYSQIGTWVPAVSASGGGAASGVTVLGHYDRKGNRYEIQATVIFTVNDLSGNLSITGLPVAMDTLANRNALIDVDAWTGITLAANYTGIYGLIASGESSIGLFKLGSGQAATPLTAAEISGACTLVLSGKYYWF